MRTHLLTSDRSHSELRGPCPACSFRQVRPLAFWQPISSHRPPAVSICGNLAVASRCSMRSSLVFVEQRTCQQTTDGVYSRRRLSARQAPRGCSGAEVLVDDYVHWKKLQCLSNYCTTSWVLGCVGVGEGAIGSSRTHTYRSTADRLLCTRKWDERFYCQ